MRIALTHNLNIGGSPEEAEFDSPATIDAIAASLERMGHEVERVEVSGSAARLVARLEALQPDLIFNTAEGHHGKTREAFYPSLFEELGIPYTGSDAYALYVSLDKALTKRNLASYGVPTPRGRVVTRETLESGALEDVTFPVIVKPNFEGSSKGISEANICRDAYELATVVSAQLARFESGVLVEQFLQGIDVACTYVEGLCEDGILEPVEYAIDPQFAGSYNLYDFTLKHVKQEHVHAVVPSSFPKEIIDQVKRLTKRIVRALNLKEHARCDFRISPPKLPGEAYQISFLEVDGLPSLEPSSALFKCAQYSNASFDDVIRAIVASACKRRGIAVTIAKRRTKQPIRVGLAFNMKRISTSIDDAEAEFDTPKTIQAIAASIESYGHQVVLLEATSELPTAIAAAAPDLVFNIAEGLRGRNRESQVPALCELLNIPYTGSDATTLSLCLDKGLTKQILRAAGIETPEWQVLHTGREKLKAFRFPVIVKPNAEGTSKGITSASVVEDEVSARAAARALIDRYGQPALIEEYIAGRELTVGLLGERRPKVLPPMEVVFLDSTTNHPVYGFEEKQEDTTKVRFECPAALSQAELKKVEKTVRDTFAALHCRDVARIDLRLSPSGTVHVIEVNPLPGLTPDFSDLCVIAKVAAMDHRTLIGEIMTGALKRLREARAVSVSTSSVPAPVPAPLESAPQSELKD